MSAPDHSANPGYRLTAGERRDDDPGTWRLDPGLAGRLKTTADGLLPAIVQEAGTGRVLMLAWMDEAALAYTLGTRRGTYWSRSRGEYWVKGMTSGHYQRVEHLALDCDRDTVLLTVTQTGAACHTGARSCFDVEPLV